MVAAVTSLATVVLSFTPLLDLHLRYVIGLRPELRGFVRTGLQISILLPAVTALASWLRGLLVAGKSTGSVYRGMMLNLLVNGAVLLVGVTLDLPGIPVVTVALSLASVVEFAYLRMRAVTVGATEGTPGLRAPRPRAEAEHAVSHAD